MLKHLGVNMWDDIYKKSECYWGLNPNGNLVQFLSLIPKGKILDIGAGEGRNALFLAKHGFKVLCLDVSEVASEKCKKLAEKLGVSIDYKIGDIQDFSSASCKFSCIICSAALPFMKKSEAKEVIEKMKEWLVPKGIILVSVFTTEDPLYKTYLDEGLEELENGTFFDPKIGEYFCFFQKAELEESFSDCKIIHYDERTFLDKAHGKPHSHGMAEIVVEK